MSSNNLDLNRTITEVCKHLGNYFTDGQPQVSGDFTIKNGKIVLYDDFIVGQRILLTGGHFAVGSFEVVDRVYLSDASVYSLSAADDISESWNGIIYGQRIPPDFISLCREIMEFRLDPKERPTTITKESVSNVHSWQKWRGADGVPLGWQDMFAKELSFYRVSMTSNIRL